MRFFIWNWFGQKNPSELLNNHQMYFRFWIWICRDIQIFVHSAYYRNTEIFLLRIIRIWKFSFHAISVYIQFQSMYYLLTLSFAWNGNTFCVFSVIFISFLVLSLYAKFHSPYSCYQFNLVPHIISIWTISFSVCIICKRKVFLRSITYSTYYQYALHFIPQIISIN